MQHRNPSRTKDVQDAVLDAVEAMYNQGDIERIRAHYHPEYVLLQIKENELQRTPLQDRIELRRKGHEEGEYPRKKKVSIRFVSTDIVDTAATVHFEFIHGGVHTCDDFMSLYRFDEGWRIVCQTTYHHAAS